MKVETDNNPRPKFHQQNKQDSRHHRKRNRNKYELAVEGDDNMKQEVGAPKESEIPAFTQRKCHCQEENSSMKEELPSLEDDNGKESRKREK